MVVISVVVSSGPQFTTFAREFNALSNSERGSFLMEYFVRMFRIMSKLMESSSK